MLSIRVILISTAEELSQAHNIRREVFVTEQNVPEEEEIDQYESHCRHFLAFTSDGIPCGTARWRFVDNGVKLERFAVKKEFRKNGVGSALMRAVLDDINNNPEYKGQRKYLHSQTNAVPLYEKFGFQKTGNPFFECNIQHYKMMEELSH